MKLNIIVHLKLRKMKNELTKTSGTLTVRGGTRLPDNDQWKNRFEIHSESSNKVYVVAQNKKKGHWGCSCPGWIFRRNCKHLTAIGLPNYSIPFTPAKLIVR